MTHLSIGWDRCTHSSDEPNLYFNFSIFENEDFTHSLTNLNRLHVYTPTHLNTHTHMCTHPRTHTHTLCVRVYVCVHTHTHIWFIVELIPMRK